MRMNMAGGRDSDASGARAGGGAWGQTLSEISALKESEISTLNSKATSALPSRRPTGKPDIEEEDGKDSFSRQVTLFGEAGIAEKSNKSNMSSILSSEGQDVLETAKARLPSVFAEEVGEL
jgi:hypothetical protein